MGITFKNSLPKITGDVRLEVATPTYSGKKSTNLNDSINPYTSAGPGDAGAGLTKSEIDIIRSGSGPGDPNFASVVYLLQSNSASNGSSTFTDVSSLGKTINNFNGTVHSTTQAKFGTSSIRFVNNNALQSDNDATTGFAASEDYTFEYWYYRISGDWAFSIGDFVGTNGVIGGYWNGGKAAQQWRAASTNSRDWNLNNGVVSANAWHHIAVTRESNIIRGFYDGILGAGQPSFSGAGPLNGKITVGGMDAAVGGDLTPTFFFTGFMDQVRITKGVARYTATFDVPTEAFPTS